MSNDYTEHGEELEADEPTPLLRRTRYVAWLLLAGSGVFLAAVIYLALPPARGLAERARPSLEGT